MLAVAFVAATLVSCTSQDDSGIPEKKSRTLRLDAIALVQGDESPGLESVSISRHGFTYLFASPENKATFEANPERYEIQLGGACARMGALSGEGTTDLFAVHEGKIYIFASEGCRRGFLKAPQKVLDRADPLPPVNALAD